MTGLGPSSPRHLLSLVVLCLVLAPLWCVPVCGQSPLYSFVVLPSTGAYSVAVDAAGASVYVGGSTSLMFLSRASNGSLVVNSTWPTSVFNPFGLALSAATSSVFVTDGTVGAVYRLSAITGQLLANATLHLANGAALDASDNLLVAGRTDDVIARFSTAGGQLALNASRNLSGLLPGAALRGLAIDGVGSVYVSDSVANRVYKLSSDLSTLLATITVPSSPLNGPFGVAVHPVTGDVWIADQNNHRVVHLFPNLTYAGSVLIPTFALGDWTPFGVALDLVGRLYVVDLAQRRLFIFNTSLLNATNTGLPATPSLLWAFNYSITGNLYSVSTCGYLQTAAEIVCTGNSGPFPCYPMTGLTGVRNATVYPTVQGAGMQVEQVSNVGTPNVAASVGAIRLIYGVAPYMDSAGITINFDSPFIWNNHTANATDVDFSVRYREFTDSLGLWQTTINSSFTLTLLQSNIAANSTLPPFTAACPAPTAVRATPAAVLGDPMFTGLLGQVYQVHGVAGAVYNLISERQCQVNARFVFLSSGRCPSVQGTAVTNCWSHPGSYLGSLSFQQVVDGQLHTAVVVAGSADRGFRQVLVDGRALDVGQRVQLASFSVRYLSSHVVEVDTAHFTFQLDNSDHFVNQYVAATLPVHTLTSHGLLGQTHRRATYHSQLKVIEGEVDDYASSSADLMATDFTFNLFTPPPLTTPTA